MKVNVDYNLVHNAITKLQNKETLSEQELKDVLMVLDAVQGDYIPSKEEIYTHEKNIRRFEQCKEGSDAYERQYNAICEFEGKYY